MQALLAEASPAASARTQSLTEPAARAAASGAYLQASTRGLPSTSASGHAAMRAEFLQDRPAGSAGGIKRSVLGLHLLACNFLRASPNRCDMAPRHRAAHKHRP